MSTDFEPSLAERLGRFVAEFDLDRSERHSVLMRRARWQILDMLGAAYVAWTSEDRHAAKLIASHAADIGAGPCTVVGVPGGTSAPVAAFLNGTLAHSFEFDDIHLATMIHCESFATAATLAVAEEHHTSGLALAEAWIVAAEIALRLASGIHKLDGLGLYEPEGFHSTSVFGAFGAAAGAAKLMGLNADQTANALALVVSFTSGTVEGWATGGARNKPIQPGWAAHAGVTAARLAAADYTCSLATIDGPQGFYHSHAWGHEWSADRVLDGLGDRWLAEEVAVKLYPCGAMCQNTVEGVEEIMHAHGIGADDVERGEIVLPQYLSAALKNMGASLYRPPTGTDALGSAPCLAARVLLDGYLGVEHMTTAAMGDARMLALADRLAVTVDEDPNHTNLPVAQQPTAVTLTTSKGEFSAEHGLAAGHPDRLTEDRIERKFRSNMRRVSDAAMTEAIIGQCGALEDVDDVAAITALLRAPAITAEKTDPRTA
ncbi:MmgE/PrpD family protein [Mycobacterium sp.]|uniref:MmgE/PrpD family protein n=1 Tax=Mycobacterium sp. TaxID=1785 RepID=UPI002D87AFAF|nr:MmgE/PrpD family protein [Mycobacterium sp.]